MLNSSSSAHLYHPLVEEKKSRSFLTLSVEAQVYALIDVIFATPNPHPHIHKINSESAYLINRMDEKHLKRSEGMVDPACGETAYLPVTTRNHEMKNNAPHVSTRRDSIDKRIVLPSPEETGHSLVSLEIRRESAREGTGC